MAIPATGTSAPNGTHAGSVSRPAPLSPARALRGRPRRLDLRVLVGLGLALLGFGGSLAFWASVSDARAVVVATRELPAGTTLAVGDLAVARVRLDEPLYQAALPADALDGLIGRQLAEPAHAQQLLVRAQLASGQRPALGPAQQALTIPASPETAAGGGIRPGDAVRVLLTTNPGKPEARTTVVLERALVYDVGRSQQTVVVAGGAADGSGARSPAGPVSSLTLIVDPEQATRLAQARRSGDLDVALLPPDAPAAPAGVAGTGSGG